MSLSCSIWEVHCSQEWHLIYIKLYHFKSESIAKKSKWFLIGNNWGANIFVHVFRCHRKCLIKFNGLHYFVCHDYFLIAIKFSRSSFINHSLIFAIARSYATLKFKLTYKEFKILIKPRSQCQEISRLVQVDQYRSAFRRARIWNSWYDSNALTVHQQVP